MSKSFRKSKRYDEEIDIEALEADKKKDRRVDRKRVHKEKYQELETKVEPED